MQVTTTLSTVRTLITPAPLLPQELFFKRSAFTCGDLQGGYPNAGPPICTGQTSICTFSGSYQGCCDNAGSCDFYTACNGANMTATCSGSDCLLCPQSEPYCVTYSFYNNNAPIGYTGYSCRDSDVGQITVYGEATSEEGVAYTTLSSSLSYLNVSSSSSGSSFSRSSTFATVSSTDHSGTMASPVATDTSTTTPVPTTGSKSHTGAIAGGVVGGIAGVAILAVAAAFALKRYLDQRSAQRFREPGPEVQQSDGDTIRSYSTGPSWAR